MIGRLLDPGLVEALGRLVPGARRTALGPSGGLHRSPFKGASVDFRQHRIYTPGDDIRRLDWRVLARTDRPFVREYDDETTRRTMLILDASGSMAYGKPAAKIDDASRLAAALAYVALAGGDGAGLMIGGGDGFTPSPGTPGEGGGEGLLRSISSAASFADPLPNPLPAYRERGPEQFVSPSGGPAQLGRVVDALERVSPAGPTALEETLARAATRVGRRALILIVSDLLLPAEALRRGLARLRHGRHEVTLIRTLHSDEIEFPFRGWLRFGGLEREADTLGDAATTRNRYLDNFKHHQRQLREACQSTRTVLIDHTVGRPLLDTIADVVRRRHA